MFSSWLYGSVLGGSERGARNLTGDLTEVLTSRLTEHLPRGLTFSGVRGGRAGGQRGSGDGCQAVTTFPLGGIQDFRDNRMMDTQRLLDDGFP